MPHIDYKFKTIKRDGKTTKAIVSFYEGQIVQDAEGKTVYQRTNVIRVQAFDFDGDISDEQLRKNLNKELVSKADGRTVIDAQKDVGA